MKAAIVAAILRLGPHQPHAEAHAEILAAQIVHAARRQKLDPLLLAALVAHESNFDPKRRGKLGELGFGQLKRDTLATKGHDYLSDDALMLPIVNLALTAQHMRRVERKCGGGHPLAWLSVYSGHRFCRPSPYSRAVVALWDSFSSTEVAEE